MATPPAPTLPCRARPQPRTTAQLSGTHTGHLQGQHWGARPPLCTLGADEVRRGAPRLLQARRLRSQGVVLGHSDQQVSGRGAVVTFAQAFRAREPTMCHWLVASGKLLNLCKPCLVVCRMEMNSILLYGVSGTLDVMQLVWTLGRGWAGSTFKEKVSVGALGPRDWLFSVFSSSSAARRSPGWGGGCRGRLWNKSWPWAHFLPSPPRLPLSFLPCHPC